MKERWLPRSGSARRSDQGLILTGINLQSSGDQNVECIGSARVLWNLQEAGATLGDGSSGGQGEGRTEQGAARH
jgi:hypothetical protein